MDMSSYSPAPQTLSSCNEDHLKHLQFELELEVTKLRGQLDSNDAKLRQKIMAYKGKIREFDEKSKALKAEQEKLINNIEKLNNELLERDVGIEASRKVFRIEMMHMYEEVNDLRRAIQAETGIKSEIIPVMDQMDSILLNQSELNATMEQDAEALNQTITDTKNFKSHPQAGRNATMPIGMPSPVPQNMQRFNNTLPGAVAGPSNGYQNPHYRPSLPEAYGSDGSCEYPQGQGQQQYQPYQGY